MRLFSRRRQLLGQQRVDRLQRADLALLEATHDGIERLQGARHLQADQVLADPLQGRGDELRGALMRGVSRAR